MLQPFAMVVLQNHPKVGSSRQKTTMKAFALGSIQVQPKGRIAYSVMLRTGQNDSYLNVNNKS